MRARVSSAAYVEGYRNLILFIGKYWGPCMALALNARKRQQLNCAEYAPLSCLHYSQAGNGCMSICVVASQNSCAAVTIEGLRRGMGHLQERILLRSRSYNANGYFGKNVRLQSRLYRDPRVPELRTLRLKLRAALRGNPLSIHIHEGFC